ncbi:PREDICTED: uncharacterized protein LOC105144348 [Acromyrmex echinatior]|uniref:uncharacterized protein LOC105144348 n=1 Tax=Acromyrmex echinatior TaxID=103372 RepID=UPI000580BF6B|nr:PREDICTED: uncharacterized protein LOC105144348 [Acromyrmex echinatior]
MLVNVTLIPFFLGIVANVSEDSYFNPEYLYKMNKIKIEYGVYDDITKLNSTIACHPIQMKILRCYLYDITSNYLDEKFILSNLQGKWFEMEFNNRGVLNASKPKSNVPKNSRNFIRDIVSQFNININIKIHGFEEDRYLGIMNENTLIGICTTTYNTAIIYREKNANEQMDSNFQIRLLKNHFFDQKDLHVHIVKNRQNCTYSSDFVNFLKDGKVTTYDHIIKLIDNKLKFITTLEMRLFYSRNSMGRPKFKETTELNLIDIRARK